MQVEDSSAKVACEQVDSAKLSTLGRNPARHNGFGLACGPEGTTETRQNTRQPLTVKLKRVRRATVGGWNNVSARKAGGFIAELRGGVCLQRCGVRIVSAAWVGRMTAFRIRSKLVDGRIHSNIFGMTAHARLVESSGRGRLPAARPPLRRIRGGPTSSS